MPVANYGVLAGTVISHGPQPGGNPHYLLNIAAGGLVYRVAINMKSSVSTSAVPPELQYQIIDLKSSRKNGAKVLSRLTNFDEFALKHNEQIVLPNGDAVDPIDFVRGNIVDLEQFERLPRGSDPEDNEFAKALIADAAAAADQAGQGAYVIVFGAGYPSPSNSSTNPRRSSGGFTGVDNVHMNQGNLQTIDGIDNQFYRENAPNQDGAVIFYADGKVTAYFTKFQSQDVETDTSGEPIHTGVAELDAIAPAVQKRVAALHPRLAALRKKVLVETAKLAKKMTQPGTAENDMKVAMVNGPAAIETRPAMGGFVFGDTDPTEDQHLGFKQDDDPDYKTNQYLLQFSQRGVPEPVPGPRGGKYPTMLLQDVLDAATCRKIAQSGQIVFHAVGDTGAPTTQKLPNESHVADFMVRDFDTADEIEKPKFFFHLGDVVYYYGEPDYYYSQFYEPYRLYPAPIIAIPGNHDGVTNSPSMVSLSGFTKAFCDDAPSHWSYAGGIARTTMTQPGVYFTLDAPLVSIIGLYSNCDEYFGYIDQQQKLFFYNELVRLKKMRASGQIAAAILAVHHPPLSVTSKPSSRIMLDDLDKACNEADFWPDAVLSGHTHLYQSLVRTVDGRQIPYLTLGSGGYDAKLPRNASRPIDTSRPIATTKKTRRTGSSSNATTVEGVQFKQLIGQYGYGRVTVTEAKIGTPGTLAIEFFCPEINGAGNPADTVVVNLDTHQLDA